MRVGENKSGVGGRAGTSIIGRCVLRGWGFNGKISINQPKNTTASEKLL